MSAEDDRKATESVLKVLTDMSIWKLKFMMGPVKTKPVSIRPRTIHPLMYDLVRQAIVDGKITVIVAPEMLKNGAGGAYFPVIAINEDTVFYDVLVMAKSNLGNTTDEQLNAAKIIVHECTHAGFDLLKLEKMTHLEHEAGAYIAGAIFTAQRVLAMKGDPKTATMAKPISKAAWDIALLEVEGKHIPEKLFDTLELAIRASPLYKDAVDNIANNDGVGREWKLKGMKK